MRGREILMGLPKTVVVTGKEFREVKGSVVEAIVEAARDTLDRTPPELAADIAKRGMVLAGEGRSCGTSTRGSGLRRGLQCTWPRTR